MKAFTAIASTLIGCVIVLPGCGSNETGGSKETVVANAEKQWRSKHLDISAILSDGWRTTHVASPGDTYDRPNELLAAFLNTYGPYSYIIKVEEDVPLDQLSLEDYLTANRNQYTSQPAYELIDETDLNFHGHQYHRFRLKVAGTKGANSMYAHIFRNGHRLISVQWTFPISGGGAIEVPESIANFDKGVTIAVDRPSVE
jgi:hypothetical protein